ncbi:hypothetical protein SOCE26_023660 [Sorangium cellulosum]|uniref:Uncharacterized protein n=1 Tax=Sorangium cellulosum TaxID=56 RepID=A0A2L0ENT0_SORCE|nr:hypothetical protein [Sorangium cellulosum]AUX40964.1 hypothetical protein SOCE26_023660 [Sorangium cellulosum]
MQAPAPDPPAPPEPLQAPFLEPAATPAPASPPPRRWPIGLLSLLHAPVFAWAALTLPFRPWTAFALVTSALALLHAATAALSLAPHPLAPRAFRVTSFCSLAALAYLSFGLLSSAVYVASLNRGLGTGIAAALLAVWAVVALFTLPFACWGLASTGGLRPRRRSAPALAALAALAVFVALSLGYRNRVAKADVLPVLGGAPSGTGAALREALSSFDALPEPPAKAPSLMTTAPAACAAPPAPGSPTLVLTHLARDGGSGRVAATTRCLQAAPGQDQVATLRGALAEALRAPLKIDVISAVQPLESPGPGLVGLSLRPGLDGLCLAERCLMPWQLIALDAFNKNAPLAGVPDFRFGVDLAVLRRALGEPAPPGGDHEPAGEGALRSGLLRIETLSYAVDREGALHLLSRIGEPGVPLTDETAQHAAAAAERYILGAQRKDGMFRYIVDPFTGRASFDGFSIARQAGTTLALCELGAGPGGPEAAPAALRKVVQRSLGLLATLERKAEGGDAIGTLVYPADSRATVANLNPTALGLVAFLSCRGVIGEAREAREAHDALVGRLARMVLATQRDDGGFAPQLDLTRATPVLGPTQLYEGGQSVLALVLLEELAARDPRPELPPADVVRAAVDRAMDYYANRYWDHFASDFVYMEENWHCLAARAALGRHRRDDYERFCLDYVAFKSRLVLDEQSGVAPDLVGGYGFGNVLPPHNTATAGFGEALAAAMALKEARGMDLAADRALMERVLGFLVRQQWSPATCFACSGDVVIEGGFSESMASPRIRIDYVQHAWAALGHGGRMLGLVPGRSAPPAGPL